MKLYIPKLGDQLTLEQDWIFDLHLESRNLALIKVVEGRTDLTWRDTYAYTRQSDLQTIYPAVFTIPADSVLSVERIYIRRGNEQFDSLTFRVKSSPDSRIVKTRFWAKLDDVNQMEVR